MFTKIFKKITSLKNKEAGKRVFILGNGPSVLEEDLSILKNEIVIGMNASTILDQKFGFTSQYYVVSDTRFITHDEKRKYATTELSKKTIRVLRSELEIFDDTSIENETFYVNAIGRDGLSTNLNNGFFFGSTTTMLAIQLAIYLGASEIILLGVDLRYSKENPRFYQEKNPQLEDAFTSVQILNIVNAHEYCNKNNIQFYSCSKRSFLKPYIPFKNFKDIFDEV